MEETKEPIINQELDKFVNKDTKVNYREQLKELIKNSTHGTRITICSKISKNISLEALVTAYEQNMGYEFSKGAVVLDDFLLEKAAQPLYDLVSKELGIGVSNLNFKQLNDIVKSKLNDDPKVFAEKIYQLNEDGYISNSAHGKEINENLKINKETKSVTDKTEYYTFTEQSIANGKKVNDYGKDIDELNSKATNSTNEIVDSAIKNHEELIISQELKEILNQTQVNLSTNFDYDLIQLIQLVKDIKYADYFAKDVLKEKAHEYVKKHPNLKDDYVEMIKDDTKIPEKYITMINGYENEANLLVALSTVNSLKKDGIGNSSADRKQAVLYIINGMKEESFGLTDHPELIAMLEKLCPDLDFKDENGNKDIRNVLNNEKEREKLKKYLPINQKEELTEEVLNNALKSTSLFNIKNITRETLEKAKRENIYDVDIITKRVVSKGLISKLGSHNREKIADEFISDLFRRSVEEIDINLNDKSLEEKFFTGSAMELTETDRKKIIKMYENSTINCWLSSKEKYLELRYSALHQIKSDLEGKENLTELEKDRLQLINMRLEEFNKQHPGIESNITIQDETGKRELLDQNKASLEMYQEYKVKSKLITTFMKNSVSITNREDYENLSDKEKKRYLKNVIAALDYKKDDDRVIAKFAKRSLEILNDGEDKFINVESVRSEDDNYIRYTAMINKKRILEEYNKYSIHKFTTYKELKEYCSSNKSMYVADKLDEYEKLQDEDFVKPEGENPKAKFQFIEKQKRLIEERNLISPQKPQISRRVSAIRIAREERESKEKSRFGNQNYESEKQSIPKNDKGTLEVDEIEISNESLKSNEKGKTQSNLEVEEIGVEPEREDENQLLVPVKDGFFRKIVNKVKEILFKAKEDNQENGKESISESPEQYVDEKENTEDSWIPKVSVDYSKVVNQSQSGTGKLQSNSTKETVEPMEDR